MDLPREAERMSTPEQCPSRSRQGRYLHEDVELRGHEAATCRTHAEAYRDPVHEGPVRLPVLLPCLEEGGRDRDLL